MSGTYDYSFVKMNEEDTKLKLITPAVEKAGWDKMRQMFCEYAYTDGEILMHDGGGDRKKVDYLLMCQRDVPIAVMEAKDTQQIPF